MSRTVSSMFWVLAVVAMLAFIGSPPVQRTQEARVLETARQMPGHGWRDWMVPHLNGRIRLQKPPLAYWMAAVSFTAGGVNDTAGRLLFSLCGVGTLAITYLAARRLFDSRVAILSTALLLTSYLFFRFTRLAETDAPAALFVTLSIAAIISAASLAPSRKRTLYFHLAAAGMALAGLAKGPPLLFAVVFLVFASIALRSNLIWRFIRSGAPITLLILLLPWYIYIIHNHGWATFLRELNNNREGGDHGGGPHKYIPWLAMGLLPWTLFTAIAIIGLCQSLYRGAPRELKLLAAWILAIALPLAATGNKQVHYLLPLMPPLMVLTGWWIHLALAGTERHVVRIACVATGVTAVGALAAAGGMAVYLHREHYDVEVFNLLVPSLIAAGSVVSLFLLRRSLQASLMALLVTVGLFLPLAVGYGSAKLLAHDPRITAAEIRARYGLSPLAFFGPDLSLPLCYNLRQSIPSTSDPDKLLAMLKEQPDLVVIVQDKSDRSPAAPPATFVADGLPVVSDEQVFTFYRAR